MLTAEHYLDRASEARGTASRLIDPTLKSLFIEIAKSYEAIAENERLAAGRSPYRAVARADAAGRDAPSK